MKRAALVLGTLTVIATQIVAPGHCASPAVSPGNVPSATISGVIESSNRRCVVLVTGNGRRYLVQGQPAPMRGTRITLKGVVTPLRNSDCGARLVLRLTPGVESSSQATPDVIRDASGVAGMRAPVLRSVRGEIGR